MTLRLEEVLQARENAHAKLDEATAAFNDEASKLKASIRKLDDWLWANTEHTADSVTEEYIGYRDARSVKKAAYEDEDKLDKAQMEKREIWLLQKLQEVGAESLRTEHGTAFIQTKTRSSCSDWPIFWKYIKDNDRFDLLEKRVSQKPVSDMREAGEELPPGLNIHSEKTVTVRRS